MRGMRQETGLIHAIIHRPDILFLDEFQKHSLSLSSGAER